MCAALIEALRASIIEILEPCARPLVIDPAHRPFVILVVGVNGSGKTTTIGKLARRCASEGKSVLLAAGDTFRAAAIEQLKVWAERTGAAFAAQQPGADPGAVIFDALQAAQRARQRRRARRHGRPTAQPVAPDGRAEEGQTGAPARRRRPRRTKCCWCSMPIRDRTRSRRRGSSTRRWASPDLCSPSSTARPRAASCVAIAQTLEAADPLHRRRRGARGFR